MFSQLKALSMGRICASAAMAVLALLLFVLGVLYAIRALYFTLQSHMTVDAAAAVTAVFCLMLAAIALLSARLVASRSAPSARQPGSYAKRSSASTDIGTELGMLLAREVEAKVHQHPKQTVVISALAGLMAGAAPKETVSFVKSIFAALRQDQS